MGTSIVSVDRRTDRSRVILPPSKSPINEASRRQKKQKSDGEKSHNICTKERGKQQRNVLVQRREAAQHDEKQDTVVETSRTVDLSEELGSSRFPFNDDVYQCKTPAQTTPEESNTLANTDNGDNTPRGGSTSDGRKRLFLGHLTPPNLKHRPQWRQGHSHTQI